MSSPRSRRQQTARKSLEAAKITLGALSSVSDSLPIDISPLFQLVSKIVDLALTAMANEEDCMKLADRAYYLLTALINETAGQDVTPQMEYNIDALRQTLTKVVAFVEQQQQPRNVARRLWNAKSDGALIAEMHIQIDRALDLFNLKSNIAIQRKLEVIKGDMRDRQVHADSPQPPAILPPPPSVFLGRQEVAHELIKAIISPDGASESARVAVLGAGGVGKTSLALFVLHDAEVETKFNEHRYFVRCDAVTTADGLLSAIAVALGVTGTNLLSRITSFLSTSHHPSLLVLDNFETPWEPLEVREAVEEVLRHLAVIKAVSLVITLRGLERPLGLRWTRPFFPPLQPLDPIASRLLFRTISDSDEDDVAALLNKLGNLPLAITLMANLAQYEDTPSLLKRWERERVSVLSRGPKSRLSNMEVSVEVSIDSPRMKDDEEALSLLTLISMLPDGVEDATHFDAITASFSSPSRAASTLKQVALAYSNDARHLAVLAPVREYVLFRQPRPALVHRRSLGHYYIQLASKAAGLETGTDGVAIIQLLAGEVGNMQSVLISLMTDVEIQSDKALLKDLITASVDMTDLCRYTGLGDSRVLELATEVSRTARMVESEAQCHLKHGELLYARSRPEPAREAFQRALELYISLDDLSGQSRAYLMLGMLQSQAGDYQKDFIQRALDLSRRSGDKIAEADCLLRLAQTSAWTANYSQARDLVGTSLDIYVKVSHVRAQARCRWLLGFVDYESYGDYQKSLGNLTTALVDYRAVGDPTGEANCLRILGRVSLARFESSQADDYLNDAIGLYHSVKWTYGLADCRQAQGEVALLRYDDVAAEEAFHEAQKLYADIQHSRGQVFCERALGAISMRRQDFTDAREHFLKARSLSTSDADIARHSYDMASVHAALGGTPDELGDVCASCASIVDTLPAIDAGRCLELWAMTLSRLQKSEEACEKFKAAFSQYQIGRDYRRSGHCAIELGKLQQAASATDAANQWYTSAEEQLRLGHDSRGLQVLSDAR